MPYAICDTDDRPVTAEEAKEVIAEHWTVPADVRVRRRSRKVGKAPKNVLAGASEPGARGRRRTGPPAPSGIVDPSAPVLSTNRTAVQVKES